MFPRDLICVKRGRERGKEKVSKILSNKFVIRSLNKPLQRQDVVFLGFLYTREETFSFVVALHCLTLVKLDIHFLKFPYLYGSGYVDHGRNLQGIWKGEVKLDN